jgi:uracil phosphoribosyltransferase|tara:strand:- start:337 stop:546 length:210 start_codon:yes stop_codon:yes gene_type:complete
MGRGMTEELIKNLEAMKYHYNQLVEAYEKLPHLSMMRRVILDDALTVIGATMDGVVNELKDYTELFEEK